MGQHQVRAAVIQDERGALLWIRGVEEEDCATGLPHAQEGHDPVRVLVEEDRNNIAHAYAQGCQPVGQPVGQAVQSLVGVSVRSWASTATTRGERPA